MELPPQRLLWQVTSITTPPFIHLLPQQQEVKRAPLPSNSRRDVSNVYYRIILTVKDSSRLTGPSLATILPRKADMTFATTPAGLQITWMVNSA